MQDTASTPDQPAASHATVLAELTRMGLDIARTLHAQITATPRPGPAGKAGAPAPDLPALAAAFDRIARCVRRTVLLAQHLAHPRPEPRPRPDPAQARSDARRHVLRAMENNIARERTAPPENPDALRRELLERIDGEDMAADLLARPLPEIIKELSEDMGLDRMPFVTPYPRRTPHDIARLLAQANGTHDPHDPAWTCSGPRRPPPRPGPDPTPHDVLALARQRR